MYGDPDELDRLARQLRQRAARVRQLAADHERKGQTTRWRSMAADALRDRLTQDRLRAEQTADRLDQVADTLEAHAQEVRELLALIASIEERVTDWFSTALDRLREAAPLVGGPLMKAAAEPPWAGWPFQPGRLPASGDRQWLEVGEFLRGKGVL